MSEEEPPTGIRAALKDKRGDVRQAASDALKIRELREKKP